MPARARNHPTPPLHAANPTLRPLTLMRGMVEPGPSLRAQCSVRNTCTPNANAESRLHTSPMEGSAPVCSSSDTPTSATSADPQVMSEMPRPEMPARKGTTSTVKVERKEAREASVVSSPTDWRM